MKKRYFYPLCLGVVLISLAGLSHYLRHKHPPIINEYTSADRPPAIHPDYTDTVIPPNIAPLNFLIKEQASRFYVEVSSATGSGINVFSKTGQIAFPIGLWKQLLIANQGQKLLFNIYAKDKSNHWVKFKTITNQIAGEQIDDYLVYRKINPVHSGWRAMGIYQRNLKNFDESLVLNNRFYEGVCLNCHTFYKNRTDKMLIDIRSDRYGSSALLVADNIAKKIGTKFSYISWHPSGRLATYSLNKVNQFFHTATDEVRGVIDMDSLILYYLVDSKTVKTSPHLSKKDRLETYPAWSPDGRYLYFCSAPMLWSDQNEVPPEQYSEVRYDLLRISYDIETDRWGEPETLISAKDTGLSILQPRLSPDGRWLLFCMCDYGSFPVYHQSSDLYLLDLHTAQQTGQYKYRRLDINSDRSESWHCWSSNSHWIAFSSKRDFGVFTRIYLSYVDKAGKVYKPILLPQKDPTFYDSCLNTYSVPELVVEPVRVAGEKLGRIVRGSRQIDVALPITMATPKAAAPTEPWQQRE